MSLTVIIALIIIGVTLIEVAIGRYPWLRMNHATIALVGAALMISVRAIPRKMGAPITFTQLIVGVLWLN